MFLAVLAITPRVISSATAARGHMQFESEEFNQPCVGILSPCQPWMGRRSRLVPQRAAVREEATRWRSGAIAQNHPSG